MKTRILLICLVIALGALQLYGQGPGQMGQGAMMPRMRILEELKLTDDQNKEVDKIKFDLAKQMIAQRSKIANARLEYQQLIKADAPDKAALEKKINEISGLMSQTGTMLLNQWFAVNKLLTPEQQKAWKKALDVAGMLEERMGMRRGMGMRQHRMMDCGMMHRGMMPQED